MPVSTSENPISRFVLSEAIIFASDRSGLRSQVINRELSAIYQFGTRLFKDQRNDFPSRSFYGLQYTIFPG
jgi:hypothetical protein